MNVRTHSSFTGAERRILLNYDHGLKLIEMHFSVAKLFYTERKANVCYAALKKVSLFWNSVHSTYSFH